MSKRKEILDIVICYIGTMLGVLAVRFFNMYVMMSIPLVPRMAVIIAAYWVIALAAIIITLIRKEPAKTYGFFKNMMLIQIGIGVAIAIAIQFLKRQVRWSGLSEFSTVYCDPHSQRLWHSQ